MATIALVSAKGSPGVSATALALALSWPSRTILAECDPAGGDALAGFLAGQLEHSGGIANLPVAYARHRLEEDFWAQLVDLDAPRAERLLLPGVRELAEAGGVAAAADHLASFFAGLERAEPGFDVIADCGRLSAAHTPWPLIARADVIAVVVRATLVSLAHARTAVADLRKRAADAGWGLGGRLGLIVIDDGPYADEAAKRLGVRLLGVLPHDPRTAAKLSHGHGDIKATDKLIRAVTALHDPLRTAINRNRVVI